MHILIYRFTIFDRHIVSQLGAMILGLGNVLVICFVWGRISSGFIYIFTVSSFNKCRPSYRKLSHLREQLKGVPLLALTATAVPKFVFWLNTST